MHTTTRPRTSKPAPSYRPRQWPTTTTPSRTARSTTTTDTTLGTIEAETIKPLQVDRVVASRRRRGLVLALAALAALAAFVATDDDVAVEATDRDTPPPAATTSSAPSTSVSSACSATALDSLSNVLCRATSTYRPEHP